MLSQQIRAGFCWPLVVCGLLGIQFRGAEIRGFTVPAQMDAQHSPAQLKFVRAFSSPSDIKAGHEILNRALDIVAGPADPGTRPDVLKSPVAVTTDSNHRIFVADPGAKTVHVFDFAHSRYSHLDPSGTRLQDPVALAADPQDNLYVVDQISRAIFVYDSAGKFRRALGKLRGGESYFESPDGIAIDRASGRIYVCDRLGQMIFAMDQRGKITRRIGKRGGGAGPAEFRLPSQIAIVGNELYVLDSGNKRIQILDTTGHFLRAINVGYAGHGAGFSVDQQRNLYITDPGLNQIQVLGRDSQSLHIIDVTAVKGANITNPSALWIDGLNRLYVIDSQDNRVGEFEITEGKQP